MNSGGNGMGSGKNRTDSVRVAFPTPATGVIVTSIGGSGLTMGMKPIVQLKIGDRITPIRMIVPTAVKHWRYARESDDISGGIMPGADLTIWRSRRSRGRCGFVFSCRADRRQGS
jgi:hypothetical protein